MEKVSLSFLKIIGVWFLSPAFLFSQMTAPQYFQKVSEAFGNVNDYSANWSITIGNSTQQARVYYKSPNKVRMDFTQPSGRFILINNDELQIYNPSNNVIFKQSIAEQNTPTLGPQSLNLFKSGYSFRFKNLSGAQPTPFEDTGEEVVTLLFAPISSDFSYEVLEVSFGENDLMRRIEGTWYGREVRYDFTNIRINEGLSDNLFQVSPPAGANVWNNFMED